MSAVAIEPKVGRLLKAGEAKPEIVDLPQLQFLMIDGQGDPEHSHEFQDAIGALYTLSYGAKFAMKKSGVDVHVMPLEALWWTAGRGNFPPKDPAKWRWTAMIPQPGPVSPELIEVVRDEAKRKKPNAALDKVRFEPFREGRCAQVLHIGPYSAEMPTIKRLHAFIAEHGYRPAGRHHEIYLGDPRRAAPEKLRTVIRQPVVRAGDPHKN
jgi:hypothetical protein